MATNERTQTNELSERLNVSTRIIQRTAKRLDIPKHKGKYLFTEKQCEAIANELKRTQTNEHERTQDIITETFSVAEYEKLQEVVEDYKAKRQEVKHLLNELSIYKNQIEYLKTSLDKKDVQMDSLINTFNKQLKVISERNHLEYLNKTEKNG